VRICRGDMLLVGGKGPFTCQADRVWALLNGAERKPGLPSRPQQMARSQKVLGLPAAVVFWSSSAAAAPVVSIGLSASAVCTSGTI
jgi:hypothetical protein